MLRSHLRGEKYYQNEAAEMIVRRLTRVVLRRGAEYRNLPRRS